MAKDPNLFFDSQLWNDKNSWRLINPKSGDGGEDVVLLRGIINDPEIGASVQNNFNTGISSIASTAIEGMKNFINSTKDQVAGAVMGIDAVVSAFKSGNSEETNTENKTTNEASTIEGNDTALGKFLSGFDPARLASMSLAVGSDYVRVYSGTGVNYSNLSFESIIYYGMYDYTPTEKMKQIIDVCQGKYMSIAGNNSDAVGVFSAPNDYIPTFRNIGVDEIKGTLRLEYGDYIYRNLVPSGFDFKISNFYAMNSDKATSKLEPLFIKINISLEQASVLTQDNLKKFISRE